MTNIENFKNFVKKNPNLVTYVKNDNMSWQKFYELYDLYGEDNSIWNDYIKNETRSSSSKQKSTLSTSTFTNIMEMAKNIDTNKLQDGISSIQKAITLFGDMIIKDKTETNTYTPRPIYRKFDD